jgi:sugar phosphate isomerase/epimerase
MTTRRRFLAAAGAAPLLSTMTGAAAPIAEQAGPGAKAASPPRELKLGAVTYNIAKDWDLPTLIRNFTEAQIGAVELRTTHAHGVEPTLSAAARADVRARFADSPVRLGGLGTTCEYHAADPAVLRRNIEETRAWLQLAHDLQCPSVKVRPNGLRADVPEAQSLEQIGRALADCGRTAADVGVTIQLEVHGRETARLPRIRRILDFADRHPRVRVCWNSNQEDLLDGGLDANFALVAREIGQIHMRDLYVEEYPWRRLVQLLQGIEFAGYCFAELGQASSDGVRVLKYFRGMFRELQGLVDPPRKA